MLHHFGYLLSEIRKEHKHTVIEWNSLIHINESISKKQFIFEGETMLEFSEYQVYPQRLDRWPNVTTTQRKITWQQ